MISLLNLPEEILQIIESFIKNNSAYKYATKRYFICSGPLNEQIKKYEWAEKRLPRIYYITENNKFTRRYQYAPGGPPSLYFCLCGTNCNKNLITRDEISRFLTLYDKLVKNHKNIKKEIEIENNVIPDIRFLFDSKKRKKIAYERKKAARRALKM